MKKVGIIGASGFIGSHITKKFLENHYQVKASVTDIAKKDKYEHLYTLDEKGHIQISELHVENEKDLKDFVSDCDIVIHGGTPFQLDVEDPQRELFDPTIKGTENFLNVVGTTPSIKKVIFIASVAAYNTNFPLPAAHKSATDIFNEWDAPFTSTESHPYAQAKFIANERVNDFIKEHIDLPFTITSVSPVMVLGKSLSHREDSTSTGMQYLIKNKIAPNPFFQMFFDEDVVFAGVNVKDVAEAIFRIAEHRDLHGKNYLLSAESYSISDLSLLLNNKKPANPPKIIYEHKLAIEDLGMKFTSIAKTLEEYNS